MCYPYHGGVHLIDSCQCSRRGSTPRNFNFVVHVVTGAAALENMVRRPNQHPTTIDVPGTDATGDAHGSAGDGGDTAGGVMKPCLCSPTRHPGSFRCRHHHADYQWVGRLRVSKLVT